VAWSLGLTLTFMLLAGSAALAASAESIAEAEEAFLSAQNALNAQNWAEAELYFERALMFNPDHAEARVQMAILLVQRGKPEVASGLIQSLIEDPRTPQSHRQRLRDLLVQLKTSTADAAVADAAASAMPIKPMSVLQARMTLGYSSNPYARANINSLTLTLPAGNVDLLVNQNIHPAPLLVGNLSYLAPNRCGFEVQDQRIESIGQSYENKLLLFCYGELGGEKMQSFAATTHARYGIDRVSAGASWVHEPWRLTAQVFKESQLERQGVSVRVEHLHLSQTGAQTLLYGEAEKASQGMPGYFKAGVAKAFSLTNGLLLLAQISLQRDFSGYSALLGNGATRGMLFAELGLQKDWGSYAGWNINSALNTGRRWSNLPLFEYKDTTLQVSFQHLW